MKRILLIAGVAAGLTFGLTTLTTSPGEAGTAPGYHSLGPCTGEVWDVKVTCVEGVANHDSPESCVGAGDRKGEALTGGGVGPVWSRERHEPLQEADGGGRAKATPDAAISRGARPSPGFSHLAHRRPHLGVRLRSIVLHYII